MSFHLEKAHDRVARQNFGECCGSRVLTAVCYWPSSHYYCSEVGVRSVESNAYRKTGSTFMACWARKTVCAVTTPIRSLFIWISIQSQCAARKRKYSRSRSSSTLGRNSWMTENRRLIHGLVKQTHLCASIISLWSQNGSFQAPQSCQFLNRSLFRSSAMVMNLDQRLKNAIPGQAAEMGFVQDFTAWRFSTKCATVKFVIPQCQATFRNREISPTSVRPHGQNDPGKISEASPVGGTHGKAAQCSTKDKVAWLHLRPGLDPSRCRTSRIRPATRGATGQLPALKFSIRCLVV